MNLDAAELLRANLAVAMAALPVPLTHTLYGWDALSAAGDNAFPPRPCIIIEMFQAQRSPGFARYAHRRRQLATDTTRLGIRILSRYRVDNPATGKQIEGIGAEHQKAVDFVRGFVTSTDSLTIPAALEPRLTSRPLGMRPESPMEGGAGMDSEGFRHFFYVVVDNLEVLCF